VPSPHPPAPAWLPLALVAAGTALLGGLNAYDAWAMAPSWGQDLAFFTQIVHSAATGGPWASPLLLEPQGFFTMVHTHLVLPLVVASYALVPRQEVLLLWQGLFAALCLWPAFRLAEGCARDRGLARPALWASLAALSLLLLGPLQAVGTCDFRPSVLFLPGILGVLAAARQRRTGVALAWGGVALLGRQEASYLLADVGLALCLLPWGSWTTQGPWGRRARAATPWRTGLAVLGLGLLSFGAWVLVKPAMFFHFDPTHLPPPAALSPDHLQARLHFGERLLRSGLGVGLLAPGALVAGLPLAWQLARDGREWTDLVGATAHYHAPWLAFALAGALAGLARWPRRLGGPWLALPLFALANALAWPWPAPRQGPVALRRLVAEVPAQARVAADYDTIHALAGRPVLWNAAVLSMPAEQRPLGWAGAWPIPLSDLDLLLTTQDDPAATLAREQGWTELDREAVDGRLHVLLRAPGRP